MPLQEDTSTRQRKSAKGQGYTVRVEGRKVLKTSLLKEQVAAARHAYNQLLMQNELLRAKEAMQMELLESYEVGLEHMGAVATKSGSTEASMPLLSAVLLDMQALELKQTLFPAAASSTHAGQHAQQQHSMLSTPAGSSTATSNASGSSGQSVSIDGPCGALDEGARSDNRTKQLLSSVTPADVLSLQEESLEELAGRLRATVGRLALARQSAVSMEQGSGTALKQAVEDFGRLCLLSLLSDEARHCKLVGLNLETMQHVAPPEGLWQAVISRANLQPKQVAHIRTAYQCCEQQQAILLQKQRETLALLQAVLSSGNVQCLQTSDSSAKPCAMAAAAAAVSTLAGSAHLVQKPEHMRAASTQAQDAAESAAAIPQHTLAHAGREQTDTGGPSSHLTAQQLQAPTGMCIRHALATDQDDAAVCCMVQGGNDLLDAAGMLTLECAEKAEQLLQDLERISRSLKQHARRLSTMFINKLTIEQHADCIVAAYPFLLNSPALCAQVALTFPGKTL